MPSVPILRADRDTALAGGTDLVRSYLRDIGRVPLLTHEQEITLGRQVQELAFFINKLLKDYLGVIP